jgi:D-lactate dehydrogenase
MTKIAFFDVAEGIQDKIFAVFPEAIVVCEPLSPNTVRQAQEAEIISVFVSSNVDTKIIKALPNLRFIACRSTGYDNISFATAHKRGILVSNVPSYGENTVAEYAFALMLALARKIPQALTQVSEGEIDTHELGGIDLAGKTLGIVGTGRIGIHAITIGRGFNMDVIGFDPRPQLELEKQLGFCYVNFRELLKESDIISIHAPLKESTRYLFNASAFRAMKPDALLVNTSRGEIIDTAALLTAIHKNQLGGVALDVVEGEELLDSKHELQILRHHHSRKNLTLASELSALEKFSNVLISPHNAFNTTEAVDRIWQTTFSNIQAFTDGKTQNIVKL